MTDQLAQARAELAAAEAAHNDARARVTQIEQRINDIQRRQREITATRLEGESSPAEAAEFAALAGDLETLSGMLTKARQEADALRPDAARNRFALAQQQADRELAQAEMDALIQKAAQLDQALCRCIGMIHTIGRQRFQHVALSQSWRPSTALDRALRLGVPPEAA